MSKAQKQALKELAIAAKEKHTYVAIYADFTAFPEEVLAIASMETLAMNGNAISDLRKLTIW